MNWYTLRPTRFNGLAYAKVARDLWRFFDAETKAAIGPLFKTRAELFANLTTFAAERGFAEI